VRKPAGSKDALKARCEFAVSGLRALDADGHLAARAVVRDVGDDDGRAVRLAEDAVGLVGDVGRAAARVGLPGVGGFEGRVVEEQLAGPGLASLDDLQVDMDGPARVPAGENRLERGVAGCVGDLDARRKVPSSPCTPE
jgi:hypothetical protein